MAKMHLKATLIVVYFSYAFAQDTKNKRQIHSQINGKDHEVADTELIGAHTHHDHHHHGGKFFQYNHNPAKDHYEHGHKRGNDHHFIERHEKAHPHAGEFKTKVRWGDKHGGYGEHYWDYNHAGHGHEHAESGEETNESAQYAPYDVQETATVAQYVQRPRAKRQKNPNSDVEFISDKARGLILSGVTGRHGGNYKKEEDFDRGKREQGKSRKLRGKDLVFDNDSEIIVDQRSGISYELKPIDY